MAEGENVSVSGRGLFVCCFADYANVWARFSAYIDLIFSIVSIVYSSIQLTHEIQYTSSSSKSREKGGSSSTFPDSELENPFSVVSQFGPNPYVYFGGTLFGFTLSIISLIGIHKRRPNCILTWLIASYFEVVVEILLCFVSVLSIGTEALFFTPYLAFQIFSIWTVSVYRDQLIEKLNTDIYTHQDAVLP